MLVCVIYSPAAPLAQEEKELEVLRSVFKSKRMEIVRLEASAAAANDQQQL